MVSQESEEKELSLSVSRFVPDGAPLRQGWDISDFSSMDCVSISRLEKILTGETDKRTGSRKMYADKSLVSQGVETLSTDSFCPITRKKLRADARSFFLPPAGRKILIVPHGAMTVLLF